MDWPEVAIWAERGMWSSAILFVLNTSACVAFNDISAKTPMQDGLSMLVIGTFALSFALMVRSRED
jgi:hypothetical protein